MDRFTAFLDANVLYPAGLRSLLMYLAVEGLFRAKWSDAVHEEWMAAVQRDFPDITRPQLEHIRELMQRHAEDSLVMGYQPLMEGLDLPDPNDRHVLAAAIRCGADVIVTRNVRDFPEDNLDPFGIDAQDPDTFITYLLDLSPGGVVAAARNHRQSLRNPGKSVAEYLDAMERHGLTQSVTILRGYATVL